MKVKQLILVLVLAALLGASWLIAVQAASNEKALAAQKVLVDEADLLAEKELFVRAIPKYKEALTYQTDNNDAIEARLLKAYLGYGSSDSYRSLARRRIERGVAEEEEYLITAQIHQRNGRTDDAIALLRDGMKIFGEGKLYEYCESIRYPYVISSAKYQEITPSYNNDFMPALNGDLWYYIDAKNHSYFGGFEEATCFSPDGYAVVKLDGTYYCITEDGDKYGVDETGLDRVACVFGVKNASDYIIGVKNGKYGFYNRDFQSLSDELQFDEISLNNNGITAVRKNDKWALITTDAADITDFIYDDVARNAFGAVFSGNAAMVKQGGSWKLIGTDAVELIPSSYADAKAPESTGYIAVADSHGKWGFINREGELVIPYQYDDAKSFSCHLGAVCINGRWGYISESGELVIDTMFDDANAFHGGSAQVVFNEKPTMLRLKFYEE